MDLPTRRTVTEENGGERRLPAAQRACKAFVVARRGERGADDDGFGEHPGGVRKDVDCEYGRI